MQARVVASPFLHVQPPAAMSKAERRTRLEDRLARHVAVLFGVPLVDGVVGRTWAGDLNLVRVGDLGRGAPSSYTDEVEDSIATALLHKYKPDTKSALVLVGADRLFSSVEPTMRSVLDVLSTSDDGLPLAPCMRVTLWAGLVVDAYLAQPALFAAAVQARSVQRAAATSWSPMVGPKVSQPLDTIETVERTATKADARPSTLGILDGIMHDLVRPRSPMAAAVTEVEGGGPSDSFLIDSVIDRWIRHLMYSADHGLAWIASDDQGTFVEAFVPRMAAVSSFAADALGQYPNVVPYGATDDAPVPFDATDTLHVRRLVPRLPSLPEVASLPRPAQVALLRTATLVCRVLRDSNVFNTPEMKKQCRERLDGLAELAGRVLGTDDLDAAYIDMSSARANLTDRRDQVDLDQTEDYRSRVLRHFDQIRQAWREGRLSGGEWVEQINDVSSTLNSMWNDLGLAAAEKQATALREQLAEDWRGALAVLGLSPHDSTEHLASYPGSISGLLHNYAGFQLKLPDLESRRWALRLGRDVILPRRRQLAEQRRNDTATRTSLQVLLRGACRTLDMVTDPDLRTALLEQIRDWRNELSRTTMILKLSESEGRYRISQLNCLNALALAEVVLTEHGLLDDPVTVRDRVRLLHDMALSLNEATSLEQLSTTSDRVTLVREIVARHEVLGTPSTATP